MDPIEHAMTVQAVVRGKLRVPAAHGEVRVPDGPVEIEFAEGMAHLRWTDGAGRACTVAIHPDEYERLVISHAIVPSVN